MNVKQQAYIERVSYGDGNVTARVLMRLVDESGRVVGSSGYADVTLPEAELARTDGEWSNSEVESMLRAHVVEKRPAIPAMLAMPPIIDHDGTVLREAVPARDEIPAKVEPFLAPDAVIVWHQPA